jgi:hypothetical protein
MNSTKSAVALPIQIEMAIDDIEAVVIAARRQGISVTDYVQQAVKQAVWIDEIGETGAWCPIEG